MKRLMTLFSIIILFMGVIFIINQTNQLVSLADKIAPEFGTVVFWILIGIYCLIVIVPIVLISKLPKPLIPPDNDNGDAYEEHIERIILRLKKNRFLHINILETEEDVKEAIKQLDSLANETIKSAGDKTFITTAISQNSALDSVFVLINSVKLVWDISHIYQQRPSPRELLWLYSNVITTAFIAGEIEDSELLEDVSASVFRTIGGILDELPIVRGATKIITNSVLSGTVNSFLILRIGCITKLYCATLVKPVKGAIRRSAFVQASGMLRKIVKSGTKKISQKVFISLPNKVVKIVKNRFTKRN